jgi:hypothetical protein
MVIVYKVVRIHSEIEYSIGGCSALGCTSSYCLSYRKNEPTAGSSPLFAFQDVDAARAFAMKQPVLTVWEAEAPSAEPAPDWIASPLDECISTFWKFAVHDGTTFVWVDTNEGEGSRHMIWQDTPPGTVLCPSITLRRLLPLFLDERERKRRHKWRTQVEHALIYPFG